MGRAIVSHVNLPYLWKTSVKGRTYWYVRHAGKTVPILDAQGNHFSAPTDPGFLSAYEACKRAIGAVQKREPTIGTLAHLIDYYRSSHNYKALKPRTKSDYDDILDDLSASIGDAIVADFMVEDVTDIMANHTPHRANYYRAVLSILFKTAMQRSRTYNLTFNPAREAEKVKYKKSPYPAWPDILINKIREEAPPEIVRAMELVLHTGQRGSDVVKMTRRNIDSKGRIHITQEKTGKKIWVRILPRLATVLKTDGKTENIYLATTKTGIPFTDNWLRKELSEWTAKLGYPGHSTHGLRKNAVIYLLTAGCTTRATAETVGMSDAMVNHYSKELNSQILADESINKLAEHDMFR